MHITISVGGGSASAHLPVFAALGVVAAAVIAGWVALRNQRRTVLIETVTAERATWRAGLRTEMAALSASLLGSGAAGRIKAAAFHRARVGILMRINPAGRLFPQPVTGGHNLDRIIDARLRDLAMVVTSEPPVQALPVTREAMMRSLQELEYAVQQLLKQEWEVSKYEAVTGRLKRPDAGYAYTAT